MKPRLFFRHPITLLLARGLHALTALALTLAAVLAVCLLALTWRLSQGPLDVSFLSHRIEIAVNETIAPVHATLGGVSVAWEGFSRGGGQPLALRLTNLTIDAAPGHTRILIPAVSANLSVPSLLSGRIVPVGIVLEGAHVALTHSAGAAPVFDLSEDDTPEPAGAMTGLLAALDQPAEMARDISRNMLNRLTSISVRDGSLLLSERSRGVTLSAQHADIDLTRRPAGGIEGKVSASLDYGGQTSSLGATFTLPRGGRSVHGTLHLSQVVPASLAGIAPVLAPLAAFDAPVTLDGEADFSQDLATLHLRVTARAGSGRLITGAGQIPLHGAHLTVTGTQDSVALEDGAVEFQPPPGSDISILRLSGPVAHADGQVTADLHITLDHLGLDGLVGLWPAGVAPDMRAWLATNIVSGTLRDGVGDIALATPDTGLDPRLVKASAALDAENLAVTWMPGVLPLTLDKAHLVLPDADRIEATAASARQMVNGAEPIDLRDGQVSITGLTGPNPSLMVRNGISGPVASAVRLLTDPAINLAERQTTDSLALSGAVTATVQATIPLRHGLQLSGAVIKASGNLTGLHASDVIAGGDLDDGAVLFDADTNQVTFKGSARLGGIPASVDGMRDFRPGPATQVVMRLAASGTVPASLLAAAGPGIENMFSGEAGMQASLTERRGGDGDLAVDADLAALGLYVQPLNWRKLAGVPAKASARMILLRDKLVRIDAVSIDGKDLSVRGGIAMRDGRPETVRLERAVLGRTDVTGTIRLPAGGATAIDLSGPVLDLSAVFQDPAPAGSTGGAGTAWSIHGRFGQVRLAQNHTINQMVASADHDGRIIRDLSVTGRMGSGKSVSLRIWQERQARHLNILAGDAGSLMSGLGVSNVVQEGILTVTGNFANQGPRPELTGTLNLTDFRVTRAPVLGKLLQAVTLYGLVDALSGAGLNFSRLVAPFRMSGDVFTLYDARAFSPSLGLTAQGTIDTGAGRIDLNGTLVPAYVFNSMLGRIPLFGRLFTAEKGGGLVAMNYSLQGPIANPAVQANPFSALTPGILRNLFGVFQ